MENDEEMIAILTAICTTQQTLTLVALAGSLLDGRRSYSSNMIEMIRSNMEKQNVELEKIASWPKTKDERAKARRKKVIEELLAMPELELKDKFKLFTILDMQEINHYLNLPPHWKYDYCMLLLGRCK